MCGIVAYIGTKEAYPIILKGLKRLEYRGYDSAGIALLNNDTINLYKRQGKVSNLESYAATQDVNGHLGIGHTRWATHGAPNDINAHPHMSMDGSIALIHNGIIENYDSLKKELINKGYSFQSETDTEVLVHLTDYISKQENVWFGEALRIALSHVVGAYAIVAMSKNYPKRLVAARKISILLVCLVLLCDF
jgi:glucosamine--fructose-6-phosphate aminotransferase (isomerizing)